MTSKERWLAAVRMEPVDRLPFWPKLRGGSVIGWPAPWSGMDLAQIYRGIGSDMQIGIGNCIRETHRKGAIEEERGETVRTTRYIMPQGELRAVQHVDAATQSWHPAEHPVKRREDIGFMAAWWRDIEVSVDPRQVERARAVAAKVGQDGVLYANMGTSGLMKWVEFLAGVENAHYFLADYPGEVGELLDAIQTSLLRRAEVAVQHSPAELFYLTENTSTSLISPDQYRRLCAPHIRDVAHVVRRAGKLMVLHMCGLLKDLLPDLEKLPVAAFEAFTAPPLGNTTLLDGRTHCPTKCLIGGTHAMLWGKPADTIIEQIYRDLDALPHHRGIVITSGGQMPPGCAPETMRTVCEGVHAYRIKQG